MSLKSDVPTNTPYRVVWPQCKKPHFLTTKKGRNAICQTSPQKGLMFKYPHDFQLMPSLHLDP
jgi:hypothetical protein